MPNTKQYSAFAIAAIEAIWPNDDGTEADLDLLDLAYLSELSGSVNQVEDIKPILSQNNIGDKDLFVFSVILFFFNPTGGFPREESGIESTGLAKKLIENKHDIFELLKFLGQENRFSNLSKDDKQAAEYVAELIKPSGNFNSDDFLTISTFIDEFKPDKGRMSYDDPSPAGTSLRSVLVARARELNKKFKNNENIEVNNTSVNSLGKGSNGLYPISVKRPDYNNFLKTSEDAYKKRRGYFKIIPLNITQASTSFSPSGDELGQSSFSISFTMDDIIVVADKDTESQIKNIPTALPISLNSGELNSILRGFDLNKIQNADEISTLGLSAYRISGANFPFNVEDLVETNDTVTIWFYHDPSEFDFVPSVEDNSNSSMLDAFVFNKDFSYVIGNASRKNENQSSLIGREINANHRILNSSGVLNPYTFPLKTKPLSGEQLLYSPVAPLSPQEVLRIIRASADYLALTGINSSISPVGSVDNVSFSQRAEVGINTLSNSFFPNPSNELIRRNFSNLLKTLYLPESTRDLNAAGRSLVAVSLVNSFEDILKSDDDVDVESLASRWTDEYGAQNLPLSDEFTYSSVISNPESVFQSLSDLSSPFTEVTNNVLNILQDNNVVNVIETKFENNNVGFFNKRKYVSTSSHGETPYLAMKGHINSVQVSYGSTGAVNKVTITGSGYDKILKENRVYYEDLFYPSTGTNFNLIEVQSIYLGMLPPTAILHFIATNAPKFIMFGNSTQATRDMRNAAIMTVAQYETLSEAEINTARILQASENTFSAVFTENLIEPADSQDESLGIQTGAPTRRPDNQVVDFIKELYKNKKVLSRGQVAIDANELNSAESGKGGNVLYRFFYPINYLNTLRMNEMTQVLSKAYYANPQNANIQSPITISTNASIANNVAAMNGEPLINHIFIDETGRLRQRISFEAWERTPNPVYIPTITDRDVISGDSSFSRDGSQVLTMVDIRPFLGGAILADVRFAGRALSDGNDYIPVLMTSEDRSTENGQTDETSQLLETNFYETLSEPFFRYGKRYKNITRDIYAQDTNAAKRKALLLQRFFEKPVKEARISVLGNTSYRAGETVLVSLQSYKHRSSEIVDVKKTLDWLNYLKGDDELRDIYIGIDERFLNDASYFLTNGTLQNRQEFFWLKNYNKEFILNKFIETFEYLNDKLSPNIKGPMYITPEFFPTTLWAFRNQSVEIGNKFNDNKKLTNGEISDFYEKIYNSLINGESSEIGEFLNEYPEAINAIRLQNFRSTSYYINSVSHNFVHGANMTTQLNLTHGQDNLVLLEPFTMRPIGFMSIERRMKIGYDDVVIDNEGKPVYENPNKQAKERMLWEEFNTTKSSIQIMYEEQFKQDKQFKESSFLYASQKNRNSSNFMHELSLDLGIN